MPSHYTIRKRKDLHCQVLLVVLCLRIITNAVALPGIETPMNQSPFGSLEITTQQTRRHLEEEPTDPFFQGCTFCGNLNVPFLSDKLLPFYNITCQELQDEHFSFIPKQNPACIRALSYEYHCCDQSSLAPRYECEDTIRNTLIKTEGYNIRTAPIPQETRQLDVSVEMKYWYLENVDVTASTFRALMQIDLTWNDPRLRWDATDGTTCVSFIDVYASHDPERSEIWVPVCIDRLMYEVPS